MYSITNLSDFTFNRLHKVDLASNYPILCKTQHTNFTWYPMKCDLQFIIKGRFPAPLWCWYSCYNSFVCGNSYYFPVLLSFRICSLLFPFVMVFRWKSLKWNSLVLADLNIWVKHSTLPSSLFTELYGTQSLIPTSRCVYTHKRLTNTLQFLEVM